MTLNGVIAFNLRYFIEFYSFAGHYVTMVEGRPIVSAKYSLPVRNIWPKLTHAAVARSLCDS